MVLTLGATSAYAAGQNSLGASNIDLKVEYFSFTDDIFDKIDLGEGVYLGLESYLGVAPNLYLGIEAGWVQTSNDDDITVAGSHANVDFDVNYVPIELNLKYNAEFAPNWVFGIGAGASYNYFDIQADVDGRSADDDDWLWGGQVFADVSYKSGAWFFGINGKYQFTEDVEIGTNDVHTDTNANNFRVGAHIGLMF
jgi:hypothetical protein